MLPAEFIRKWSRAELSERAASQEHFIDLCRLIGVKTPAEVDPTGEVYTFEKGVSGLDGSASRGSTGGRGFADVWYRGRFAWEYKRKGKYQTLDDAYRQLCVYREALENPPLLVVSDIARTEIHTNFTGTKKEIHTVLLEELGEAGRVDLLRRIFTDPESFRPTVTPAQVTEQVAKQIGTVAQSLRERGHAGSEAAHFLMKVMFCLFAEDVLLLPRGLFQKLLEKSKHDTIRLKSQMDRLFGAMRTGGDFGVDEIPWFNGGLFDESQAIELTEREAGVLLDASKMDWGSVEPAVFGTLFERSLDPSKRSQIGAHYTSREDIMLVVEPVILRPLRREWDGVRAQVEEQIERRRKAKTAATKKRADETIAELLDGYVARLSAVRILDPACGSGNFLYVAIQKLLDLEKEVITFAASSEIALGLFPKVRPTQLYGIEINPYAAELAQVVIWIGYLQWMRDNGFNAPRDPILSEIGTIDRRDAILAWRDAQTKERIPEWREGAECAGKAHWPEADYIIGNPPFLGTKLLRGALGSQYVEAMFGEYDDRIPAFSDLCCYWFELAQSQMQDRPSMRIGLLATQGIRGKESRRVLERLADHARIFEAHSDRKWILDGAAVHVSIVCASTDESELVHLDNVQVEAIHSDLSAGNNLTTATVLGENRDVGFVAGVKAGKFDIDQHQARLWLASPSPNARSPFDVVRPWMNGLDITRRPRAIWIVDFGNSMSLDEAAGYGEPFEHARREVKPARDQVKRKRYRELWWLHAEPCQAMRDAIAGNSRFLATAVLTKYRLYKWLDTAVLPDHQLIAFARSDDYFFGVLHSSVHELWALRQGTQLEDRPRYTPTTCFETFPLPWSPGSEPGEGEEGRALHDAIASAARELDAQRERWLNPPEWVEEVAAGVDASDDFADVARVSGEEARRLIRQSAIDAACASDPRLKKRTLTNLYNERPMWLRLAHRRLDEAVLAAYAAVDEQGAWDASWAEVFEETGAGVALPEGHALAERRKEVEQEILGGLLRLNAERAG